MRTLFLPAALLGVFLCTPFSSFAQTSTTSSTTTARQVNDALYQQQINEMIQEQQKSATSEIEALLLKSLADLLEVKTQPTNPGPQEVVRVSVESYLRDLNKATITWTLNDKVKLSGVGEKKFSFQNGASGETSRLTITITTNVGETITKELSWTPVGVTLFWEADTYTPPFYRGKPLLSPQATIKVIATPDTTGGNNPLSAGKMVYTWIKEGAVQSSVSGYGKNVFSFTGPQPYRQTNIVVKVSSVDDSVNSEARINPTLTTPFILFYENNPLLGVLYNKPLETAVTLTGKEITINAEPFFFSRERGAAPSFEYKWSANGRATQNEGTKITLRNESQTKGSSLVSFSLIGIRKTFQAATQNLLINFDEASASGRPIF